MIPYNETNYYNDSLWTFMAPYNNNDIEVNVSDSSLVLQKPVNSILYQYTPPFMLTICFVSMVINTRVLLSIKWIRRPLTPTLYISLSLAAADACSSLLLGVGLLINSYLPKVFDIDVSCHAQMWFEMFRLSMIIVTVMHLVALTVNHWLGISRPLKYTAIISYTKMSHVAALLWLLPVAFFGAYFICQDDGCRADKTSFFDHVSFRATVISFFLIPFMFMICCYSHILIIVREQQRIWRDMSRAGSKRSKGGGIGASVSRRSAATTQQSMKAMEGNIKAVYTTLLILGSYVVGWVPALVIFIFICHEGCVYKKSDWDFSQRFLMGTVSNVLVILKTLVNPIIYSTRMWEIKEGMRRMDAIIVHFCCRECKGVSSGNSSSQDSKSNNCNNKSSTRTHNYYSSSRQDVAMHNLSIKVAAEGDGSGGGTTSALCSILRQDGNFPVNSNNNGAMSTKCLPYSCTAV